MADATIDLLKNSSYVGKMDELIAAVKSGGGATSDVEWDNVKNKPTTIGGYGIIDAKIDNGTITLGNQTITPLTSAPVTSVNSKTGAVTLSATDVSAIPSTLTGTAGQVLTKTADGQEWKDVDIPTALPNPNALTFTGAVTGTYDGSTPLEVLIPSGGGGDDAGNELKLAWSLDVTQTLDSVSQEIVFSTPPKMIFIYGIGVENSTSSNAIARISISNNGNSISSENFNLEKFSGPSGTPNYSCAVILFFKNTYLFAYSNSTSSDFHSWNHKNQNVSYYSNPGQLVDWDKITIGLWNVTAGRIEIYSDSEVV